MKEYLYRKEINYHTLYQPAATTNQETKQSERTTNNKNMKQDVDKQQNINRCTSRGGQCDVALLRFSDRGEKDRDIYKKK